MSRGSKITLAATGIFAVTTIVFVHFQQRAEKTLMHQGVIRDMETQRQKEATRRERQADFDLQRELEAEYKQSQKVHDALRDMDSRDGEGRGGGGGEGGGSPGAGGKAK